jgi:hypothetical protein
MNARRIGLVVLIVCGTLGLLAYWRGDWALAHRRVSVGASARPTVYSAAECKRFCDAAFLPVAGIDANTPDAAVSEALTRLYGATAAATLMREREHGWALVGKGTLFFPTRDLCEQKNLSGECAELCRRFDELH